MAKVTPGKKTPVPVKGKIAPVAARPVPTAAVARRPVEQQVEQKGTKALALVDDDMLAQDLGSGMEHMTRDSFAIPRMVILQGLSPAVSKGNPGQIDGAEAGMIMENVSQTLWDGENGLLFLPISYRFTHLNWWPRNTNKGKGFIGDLGADPKVMLATVRGDKGGNLKPDGSEIVPTMEYFGFIVDEGTGDTTPVVVSMSKSQIKKGKRLNSLTQVSVEINGKREIAPLFYRTYRMTTVPETNGEGQTFMNWNVEPGPALLARAKNDISPEPEILSNGDEIYKAARAFKSRVDQGEVRATAPVDDGGSMNTHHGDDSPM